MASLVRLDRWGSDPNRSQSLAARDYSLGRAPECDIRVGPKDEGISRRHATLHWTGTGFEIRDEKSMYGTLVDGEPIASGASRRLDDGSRISLGNVTFVYRRLHSGSVGIGAPHASFLRLVGRFSSLDPAEVVARSLELLRLVSGIERSLLVDAGRDPRLASLLVPLHDPSLRLSRSTVERALASGKKVTVLMNDYGAPAPTMSIAELDLSRVWVRPISGDDGVPIAAVYLDSTTASDPFDDDTESLMDALVEQIGLALRNASLHAALRELSEGLERKVGERTRELEASRSRLMAQDRLATMGRLVAGIAHEMNNPIGAIASFANTQAELLEPVLRAGDAAGALFQDRNAAGVARRFVEGAIETARRAPLDSRARRALEERLDAWLTARKVAGGSGIARRLARLGYGEEELEPFVAVLAAAGDSLSVLAEKVHTFARAAVTISDCAGNVARIVDGLKTYAHLDHAQLEEADLHRGIEATLSVLHSRIPAGIRVETRFATIPPFPHRPGELTQVWTNLVDNAVRAMGETGTLRISTQDLGNEVEVRVEDDGPGIPKQLQERIFELHVTTRGPGAGLGLGLPICKTIVEANHGGAIAFESEPGHTVFRVRVPKHTVPQGGATT